MCNDERRNFSPHSSGRDRVRRSDFRVRELRDGRRIGRTARTRPAKFQQNTHAPTSGAAGFDDADRQAKRRRALLLGSKLWSCRMPIPLLHVPRNTQAPNFSHHGQSKRKRSIHRPEPRRLLAPYRHRLDLVDTAIDCTNPARYHQSCRHVDTTLS